MQTHHQAQPDVCARLLAVHNAIDTLNADPAATDADYAPLFALEKRLIGEAVSAAPPADQAARAAYARAALRYAARDSVGRLVPENAFEAVSFPLLAALAGTGESVGPISD